MILISISVITSVLAIIFWLSYQGIRVTIKELRGLLDELDVCINDENATREELLEVVHTIEDVIEGF